MAFADVAGERRHGGLLANTLVVNGKT